MSAPVPTFGTCASTQKINYGSRRDAKYVIRKRAWVGKSAFSCDCGYFHIGGKHGILDRSAHRALHGVEEVAEDEHLTIDAAAAALGVTPDALRLVIAECEWVRGDDESIHEDDVSKLRELTWRRA